MGWSENMVAGSGTTGARDTLRAASKGNWKGAGNSAVDSWADVTTMGISKGIRDKKLAEKEAAKRSQELSDGIGDEAGKSLEIQKSENDRFKSERNKGFDSQDASDKDYESRVRGLTSQAEGSARDSRGVYNTMSSQYRSMQDSANEQAGQAMSLRDFSDPNNRVSTQVRDIYNAEGTRSRGEYNSEAQTQRDQFNTEGELQQGRYETNAKNETRGGQADFGVLSALGAQSMGQAGMGPMTVGQQMAMSAQSQRQAGEAYAGAQRRVQGLRDQGLQANLMNRDRGLETSSNLRGRGVDNDSRMRERGIESGFDRSDATYAAGESARDRQGSIMRDRDGMERGYRNYEINSRGERDGFSQNLTASEKGRASRGINRASEDRGMNMEVERSRMSEVMRKSGASEASIQLKMNQMSAEQAQYAKTVGTGVSAVGTVAGGIYGGPAGAKAGNEMGKGISESTPEQAQARANPQDRFMQNDAPNASGSTSNFRPQSQSGQSGAFGDYLKRKYPNRSSQNA